MNSDTFDKAVEGGLLCLSSLEAIISDNGAGSTVHDVYRSIYKYTACGPHLSVRLHDGRVIHSDGLRNVANQDVRALQVGSIVEGTSVEIEAQWIDLLNEDTADVVSRFNAAVQWVNEEATRVFEDKHGTDGEHE